ncbi:MAG: formate acetyltransferase [Deltaproteobacteria bacterium]|nr:formate acetyltransferase [Deltaproteobacteria bacterium]
MNYPIHLSDIKPVHNEKPHLFDFASSETIEHKNNKSVKKFLKVLAFSFNTFPWLKKELKDESGWINFKIGIAGQDNTFAQTIACRNGKLSVTKGASPKNDTNLICRNFQVARELTSATSQEAASLITSSKIMFSGDITTFMFANYLLNRMSKPLTKREYKALNKADRKERSDAFGSTKEAVSRKLADGLKERNRYRMKGKSGDDVGVKYLDEPYLSAYSLDSFPRIQKLYKRQQAAKPEMSTERPGLLTAWYKANGFETDTEGKPWFPPLRNALAYKHLMENKVPVIQKDNLIAGTIGPEEVSVILYPDGDATLALWAELETVDKRPMNPFTISKEGIQVLKDVFPFWRGKGFANYVAEKYDEPLCKMINDRMSVYANLMTTVFSHTLPNIPKILEQGTLGVKKEIDERLNENGDLTREQKDSLQAMKVAMEGLELYAENISNEAGRQASREMDPRRKEELLQLADICKRVPKNPSETLQEAMNAGWMFLVGVLMENTNISLSPGRLDQYFQPYFEKDMAKIADQAEKRKHIERAIELAACFYMRISSHFTATPDMMNYMASGTRTDSAVTLGGITPDGKDAVNDMSYIFLKATEMLIAQEPNVNVRFHPDINSKTFLDRVCEVNYITVGTPSIHNDKAVFKAFEQHKEFEIEDIRDWGAVGCVEPSVVGKHTGHTNALSMNLMAGFEMTMNNGYHSLIRWHFGPKTGSVEKDEFKTFDQFFDAYMAQMQFLIDNHCDYNKMLGEAHFQIRPQPFLSAVTVGCIENAMDNTMGGAKYNSSGSFNAGLADLTDSMLSIRKFVFDDQVVTFPEMKKAIDDNFEHAPELYARIKNKLNLFGSDDDVAAEMANRIIAGIHKCYARHRDFRDGKYMTGYWSVAFHAAFGVLSGALPSGRLKGKSFTPGLTPQPHASRNILDNLRDVAKLDPKYLENNIAFNVKYISDANDSREEAINTISSYVKTFFDLGGMQLQFNMVDSETPKDAMAHPENYSDLIVRISGYNAYFTKLSKDLQIEIIERSEFC